MNYAQLNAFFLLPVVVVGVWAAVIARRRGGPRIASIALAAAVLLLMTAVFDNVMIGIGLVGYEETRISGSFIGIAPVEDFAYAIAAIVLLPSLWVLLTPRRSRD
jgi:lycopene cyclase domain-containing protein